MQKTIRVLLSSLVVLGFAVLLATPLLATPVNAQIFFFTATAAENGNIYYVVRQNDSCESISAMTGVDIDFLREMNDLDLDACRFLQVGQLLLIGTVPTAVVTAGPSPTPTSNLPTPMPLKGTGTICIYLYNDINGNALAETDEITNTGLAGGEVSVNNVEGDFAKIGTTLGDGNPICFEEAPEGNYNISIAIPDGYNATASQNYQLSLKAGDTATVNFSAQASSSLSPVDDPERSSLFLAVVGGVIILLGIGLGFYVRFLRRK